MLTYVMICHLKKFTSLIMLCFSSLNFLFTRPLWLVLGVDSHNGLPNHMVPFEMAYEGSVPTYPLPIPPPSPTSEVTLPNLLPNLISKDLSPSPLVLPQLTSHELSLMTFSLIDTQQNFPRSNPPALPLPTSFYPMVTI